MNVVIEHIVSGAACGKQRMRVETNRGKLLGWIQVTQVDWSPILGATTVFVVKSCHDGDYTTHIAECLAEAFGKLGVSISEMDNSKLPDGCYHEFTNPYHI